MVLSKPGIYRMVSLVFDCLPFDAEQNSWPVCRSPGSAGVRRVVQFPRLRLHVE